MCRKTPIHTWLSGVVPRLPSYGIYILQLVRFARCYSSVFDFHSKNLQITSKLLTQGYRYHNLGSSLGHTLWTSVQICCNIVSGLCITRNYSPCLLRRSCLQTSEGQRRSEFHLVGLQNSEMPAKSSVCPSDHREDYMSCAWPFYSLVQIIR